MSTPTMLLLTRFHIINCSSQLCTSGGAVGAPVRGPAGRAIIRRVLIERGMNSLCSYSLNFPKQLLKGFAMLAKGGADSGGFAAGSDWRKSWMPGRDSGR